MRQLKPGIPLAVARLHHRLEAPPPDEFHRQFPGRKTAVGAAALGSLCSRFRKPIVTEARLSLLRLMTAGQSGPVDRLLECWESAAGPSDRPPAGDSDPRGRRRQPLAYRSPTAHRKRCSLAGRRVRRIALGTDDRSRRLLAINPARISPESGSSGRPLLWTGEYSFSRPRYRCGPAPYSVSCQRYTLLEPI